MYIIAYVFVDNAECGVSGSLCYSVVFGGWVCVCAICACGPLFTSPFMLYVSCLMFRILYPTSAPPPLSSQLHTYLLLTCVLRAYCAKHIWCCAVHLAIPHVLTYSGIVLCAVLVNFAVKWIWTELVVAECRCRCRFILDSTKKLCCLIFGRSTPFGSCCIRVWYARWPQSSSRASNSVATCLAKWTTTVWLSPYFGNLGQLLDIWSRRCEYCTGCPIIYLTWPLYL